MCGMWRNCIFHYDVTMSSCNCAIISCRTENLYIIFSYFYCLKLKLHNGYIIMWRSCDYFRSIKETGGHVQEQRFCKITSLDQKHTKAHVLDCKNINNGGCKSSQMAGHSQPRLQQTHPQGWTTFPKVLASSTAFKGQEEMAYTRCVKYLDKNICR